MHRKYTFTTYSRVLHKNKIANNLWKRYSAVVCPGTKRRRSAVCINSRICEVSMHVCGKIGEELKWVRGVAGRTVVQRCARLSVGLEL